MTHLSRLHYEVRSVSQSVAAALVEEHHYARGGANTGVFRHGLFRRGSDEPLGVAWWLPPTKVAAQSVCEDWRRVLSLTRLVVVPDMPTNAASFLLGASIRLIRRDGRWCHLVTYADEGQGHRGQIYRATNWHYVGTVGGHSRWLDPASGRHVARKSTVDRTSARMLELGYVRTPPTRKHKFVMELE